MILGLLPAGLLGYGLYSRRRGFIWVGGIWLGLDVLWNLAQRRPEAPRP
jgi:hypothetical protein